MAQDEDERPTYGNGGKALDGTAFQRWLIKKDVPLNCPVCRNGAFAIETPPSPSQAISTIAVDIRSPSLMGDARYLPHIALICQTCGNTLLFSRNLVASALDEEDA
jgi:hypothetical protein